MLDFRGREDIMFMNKERLSMLRQLFLFVFCILLFQGESFAQLDKADGKIVTSYDKFTDRTKTTTIIRVLGEGFEGLAISASFEYESSELKFVADLQKERALKNQEPLIMSWFPKIVFGFVSVGKERKYKDSDTFIVLADGERWRPLTGFSTETTPKMKVVIEAFISTMTVEQLLKLANSKTVEVRLGTTELELTETQLAPLRGLAARALKIQKGQPQ